MSKFNVDLMRRIISKQMVGTDFTYDNKNTEMKETKHVRNVTTAYEVLADMLGYQNEKSFLKILRQKNSCPHPEKMEILEEKFGVSFYLNEKKIRANKADRKEGYMHMSEIAKNALISMYGRTIKFFNSTIDCVEDIENLLLELEEFELAIPEEVYTKFVEYLRESIYELPEVDESDLVGEGNVIAGEYEAKVLIARYLKRTIDAKQAFVQFATSEFAQAIQFAAV